MSALDVLQSGMTVKWSRVEIQSFFKRRGVSRQSGLRKKDELLQSNILKFGNVSRTTLVAMLKRMQSKKDCKQFSSRYIPLDPQILFSKLQGVLLHLQRWVMSVMESAFWKAGHSMLSWSSHECVYSHDGSMRLDKRRPSWQQYAWSSAGQFHDIYFIV